MCPPLSVFAVFCGALAICLLLLLLLLLVKISGVEDNTPAESAGVGALGPPLCPLPRLRLELSRVEEARIRQERRQQLSAANIEETNVMRVDVAGGEEVEGGGERR